MSWIWNLSSCMQYWHKLIYLLKKHIQHGVSHIFMQCFHEGFFLGHVFRGIAKTFYWKFSNAFMRDFFLFRTCFSGYCTNILLTIYPSYQKAAKPIHKFSTTKKKKTANIHFPSNLSISIAICWADQSCQIALELACFGENECLLFLFCCYIVNFLILLTLSKRRRFKGRVTIGILL